MEKVLEETGGRDGYRLYALLYFPTKGLLTCFKGRKGPTIALPNLQVSLLRGFPSAKGSARLKHHPPRRELSCREAN